MRILICDDDLLCINELKKLLTAFFSSIRVKCPTIVAYPDGASLLADTGEKDILFLDMEMPGMNGIFVGHAIKKEYPSLIIFVITSFSAYLDDAMRFHVFRYLSKPIDKQRFFRNMKDALGLYHTTTKKVIVETKNSSYTLLMSSIVFLEAFGKKVIVHTETQTFDSIHTMQYWIDFLPKNMFFQTHRSYIINFKYVTDFDNTLVHLTERRLTAYLTRRRYGDFKTAYLLYLESTR